MCIRISAIVISIILIVASTGISVLFNGTHTTKSFEILKDEISENALSVYNSYFQRKELSGTQNNFTADNTFSPTNDDRKVIIGGELIGIELYGNGISVIGTESFESVSGTVSPASDAGIEKGDRITEINGRKILDKNDFTEKIKQSNGERLSLTVNRKDTTIQIDIKPEKTATTGIYKAGIWIKDSTGGIGTLTYIDANNGTIGALGHAVFETETDVPLEISHGYITDAKFIDVEKGITGKAGQIYAAPTDMRIGTVNYNGTEGIFGYINHSISECECFEVAAKDEISTGPAEIICTVSETGKETYSIKILKISDTPGNGKDMTIEITDEKLLDITSGIVQGMSGSPIIQNGKFVGAVTHVFLNNPKYGYGIFAEEMLSISDKTTSLTDTAA